MTLDPRGHLPISGDIIDYHKLGMSTTDISGQIGYTYSTIHKTAPCPQYTKITQPNKSIALRLRNSALVHSPLRFSAENYSIYQGSSFCQVVNSSIQLFSPQHCKTANPLFTFIASQQLLSLGVLVSCPAHTQFRNLLMLGVKKAVSNVGHLSRILVPQIWLLWLISDALKKLLFVCQFIHSGCCCCFAFYPAFIFILVGMVIMIQTTLSQPGL